MFASIIVVDVSKALSTNRGKYPIKTEPLIDLPSLFRLNTEYVRSRLVRELLSMDKYITQSSTENRLKLGD